MGSTDNELPREANVVTRTFLEETLKSAERREDIVVKDFSVSMAAGKGDNYCAVVLRVHASCQIGNENKMHHLIVKLMHDNDYYRTLMADTKIFEKEVMAYKELYPAFIQYQVDKGLEPIPSSVPRFYHSIVNDKEQFIVLEDLCPYGYRMADKRKGLDYDHCKLVMNALATFHALSYAMKDGNPANLKENFSLAFLEAAYCAEHKEAMIPMMIKGVESAVDVVTAATENAEIKERAKKLLNMDVYGTMQDLLKAEEPFSVICHGDVWSNNMIFKYKSETDNTPTDIKLFDLQISRYALPTVDLAYFFYLSTTRSLRQAHLINLLQLYHKTFLDTLDHVKVKISGFTFEVLERMFKKTMLFGIISACLALPHILGKAEDVSEIKPDQSADDFHKLVDEQAQKMLAGSRQLIEERIVGVVQDAVDLGAL